MRAELPVSPPSRGLASAGSMASSPSPWAAWKAIADELDSDLRDAPADKPIDKIVQELATDEKLALFDRNSLDTHEWRPVYLHVEEVAPAAEGAVSAGAGAAPARTWKLYTVLNQLLDEPGERRAVPPAASPRPACWRT